MLLTHPYNGTWSMLVRYVDDRFRASGSRIETRCVVCSWEKDHPIHHHVKEYSR